MVGFLGLGFGGGFLGGGFFGLGVVLGGGLGLGLGVGFLGEGFGVGLEEGFPVVGLPLVVVTVVVLALAVDGFGETLVIVVCTEVGRPPTVVGLKVVLTVVCGAFG